ncbi:ribonuclease J [Metabacillus hrfriensis]|uniref:Ribonuclease J n=1 Tax=Metabacillus hrfriensis TaxID=3048891 RepID=A0ACD4REJ5_9BACI|nr:ribonuclease J [Metabacillus sp. CT-WN-B3]WHZ58577.1 ribonuclease J [Metabacillus sp. CT-WN-B3]
MTVEKNVKIIPLGGMGEIGKNMYLVEYEGEIVIVDSGVKFPDEELRGVDYIIPDYTYLVKNAHKVKGLFITHGHEDHIGGVPFLLKKLNVPVFAGRLAMGFIRSKLDEHNLLRDAELHEITEESTINLESLKVTFFRTTHSIPDSFGVVIHSPIGNIVHTGDFKFDLTPTGPEQDLSRVAKVGQEGVLCLLSDSTNSEVPGFSVSEKKIGQNILDLVRKQSGRIIVALFASNVFRLQQVIKASVACGRKVAYTGRSMERAISIGLELGYIEAPSGTFIDPDEISSYKNSELTILCTGSQGEPFAALSRIAEGKHRHIHIEEGDTIIFSSSPIPGNVLSVNRIINKLMKAGADVIDNKLYDIHTSGHGGQEELKLMLKLLNPKFLVPIHGEYRMQKMHQTLAMECFIPEEDIFILDNGHVLNVSSDKAYPAGKVPARSVYVDGNGIGDVGTSLLGERKQLADSGIISILIFKNGEAIIRKPQIISRGFVYLRESNDFIVEIEALAAAVIREDKIVGDIEKHLNSVISDFIYKRLKRSPIVVVKVIDVKKEK